jgi:hypothetical protein
MSDKPLYAVIEDAIWQALDSEQGMPHSGVDPVYVVPEFLRLLSEAGYTVAPKEPESIFRSGGQTYEYGPRPHISVPRPPLS